MALELFVNGTLMRGLALHENLHDAEFMGEFVTAPNYRLYSIDDEHPAMFAVDDGGVAVKGEMYRMSEAVWKRVEESEPPNLYCGPVTLADGSTVNGILFPKEIAKQSHLDISEFGDWRAYMASKE